MKPVRLKKTKTKWLHENGIEALELWEEAQLEPRKINPRDPEEFMRLACGPLGLTVTQARELSIEEVEYLACMWIERQYYEGRLK